MKIHELQEAIKGWKHAHRDLTKMRSDRAAAQHTAKLVSIKKDGTESRMHDAAKTFPTEAEAREYHARIVKLNPGRNIRHNLYVDGNLVHMLDMTTLQEVAHDVGKRAEKVLTKIAPQGDQDVYVKKWQALDKKEKHIQNLPDAHTGKYAKQLTNISIQKIKVARAGNLNAHGDPLQEDASPGATASGNVASLAMPLGAIQRRPHMFGLASSGKTIRKKRKS